MADPARIKNEGTLERITPIVEHLKSEDTKDVPITDKPADEIKESPSEDHVKEEAKSVSPEASFLYHKRTLCL